MTTSQNNSDKPITKKPLFWGCIIVLVMACLSALCLGSVLAFSSFTNLNILNFNISDQINEFFSGNPTPQHEAPIDFTPDIGSSSIEPYQEADFPFRFSYPTGWEMVEIDSENIRFNDPASNSHLRIGRDWLCNGCRTAADAAVKYSEVLEFQAELDNFETIEDTSFVVDTGDDAHYTANEWVDFEGNFQWSHHIHIVVEDYAIYIIMEGDDPAFFDAYRDTFMEIGKSFDR